MNIKHKIKETTSISVNNSYEAKTIEQRKEIQTIDKNVFRQALDLLFTMMAKSLHVALHSKVIIS